MNVSCSEQISYLKKKGFSFASKLKLSILKSSFYNSKNGHSKRSVFKVCSIV